MVDCRMAHRDDVMIEQNVAPLIFLALYSFLIVIGSMTTKSIYTVE
jgi:hypothetical protein